MSKIKVGINGYGTIGKRVGSAVLKQDDMDLVGVTANSFNYRVNVANKGGINIFSKDKTVDKDLKNNGLNSAGNLDDLLESIDVIVDCTPKPLGSQYKELYDSKGVKSIFQGGEKAEVADMSFVSQCDYYRCVGQDSLRVVSCNTTGLSRTLHPIDKKYGIEHAHVVLIRRGTDSYDHKKGPINAIVPSFEQPSHHGPDVRTVLPRLEIFSTAYIVPTTLMHVHDLVLDMRSDHFNEEDIIELLNDTPRVKVLPVNQNINSTAQVMDYSRDMEINHRGDMQEIGVWDKSVGVYRAHGYNRLFIKQAIHQESNVIPENIDAIRALSGFSDSDVPKGYKKIVEDEREKFKQSYLYLGKGDHMEEVNPSRIITDSNLGLLKK
tara:strand:- start:414 stop:1550 length:1137 start_codon:yes stop_codon:yes gene_type:complete